MKHDYPSFSIFRDHPYFSISVKLQISSELLPVPGQRAVQCLLWFPMWFSYDGGSLPSQMLDSLHIFQNHLTLTAVKRQGWRIAGLQTAILNQRGPETVCPLLTLQGEAICELHGSQIPGQLSAWLVLNHCVLGTELVPETCRHLDSSAAAQCFGHGKISQRRKLLPGSSRDFLAFLHLT